MGIKDESESATSPLMERDHTHNPRDLFISIYLASQGFPIVSYVTWGQDTVSEMPRAAPFTSHSLTRVWVPAEVWVYTAATLSHCFPPYLNVSTQNLKHLTNRLVKEELILPVPASYHSHPRVVPRPGLLGSTKGQGEPSSKPRIFQPL